MRDDDDARLGNDHMVAGAVSGGLGHLLAVANFVFTHVDVGHCEETLPSVAVARTVAPWTSQATNAGTRPSCGKHRRRSMACSGCERFVGVEAYEAGPSTRGPEFRSYSVMDDVMCG